MNNALTPQEKDIIENKHTEPPYSGEYDNLFEKGMFFCKKCSSPLYSSDSKFDSGCGWPSFDEDFENAVKRIPDNDGFRTEIVCAECNAHLGHVFEGERITPKNTRHCVNSLSIKFIPQKAATNIETIYLGGGCFWCVEAAYKGRQGIVNVESGYSGGSVMNPTYEQVCTGNTGHAEVVKLEYDNTIISLEEILDVFYKIHDPTTKDRQGNDVGKQYRSVIFYTTLDQLSIIEIVTKSLNLNKYENRTFLTEILPFMKFFVAESYHQDYYTKNPNNGYCKFIIDPKLEKIKE